MNKIHHTVFVFTYNQQAFIERCIRSLFEDAVCPDRVYIFNDCSTDSTLEILEKLEKEFFGVLHIITNSKNLGIFENINQVKNYPVGDYVHFLAGDDWFLPGLFREINFHTVKNNLKPQIEPFAFVSSGYTFDKDGNFKFKDCNIKSKLFKSMLRREIFYIPIGLSKAYFNFFPAYRNDLGVWGDFVHSIQFTHHCSRTYKLNKPYVVYRLGSGVTSKLTREELNLSFLKSLVIVERENSNVLDKSDMRYLSVIIYLYKYLTLDNEVYFAKLFLLMVSNLFNGIKGNDFKAFLACFFRRLIK